MARDARLLSLLDDDLVGLQLVVIVVTGAVSGHLRGNRRSQRASLLLRACASLGRRALHLEHVLVKFSLFFELVQVLELLFDSTYH